MSVYTCTYIYIHTCIHMHMYIYIHIYTYIHIYMHMATYIHTYIHKHTHTHTRTLTSTPHENLFDGRRVWTPQFPHGFFWQPYTKRTMILRKIQITVQFVANDTNQKETAISVQIPLSRRLICNMYIQVYWESQRPSSSSMNKVEKKGGRGGGERALAWLKNSTNGILCNEKTMCSRNNF